jgi:hypothetical protein
MKVKGNGPYVYCIYSFILKGVDMPIREETVREQRQQDELGQC